MTDAVTVRPRVVTLGETMALLRTREIGSLRHAAELALGIGGAESNVAIGLQRLGVDSSWLGRVGDDPLGERVLREIRAEGVDARCVVDEDAATGLMLKEHPSSASTAVFYYRSGSAGSRLAPGDLPEGWIEEAAILHVTGITALVSSSARDTLFEAISRAKAAGVKVSFDINYRSALATAGCEHELRRLAEQADIVFGGVDELAVLHPGADPAEAAARLIAAGTGHVVLKRGAEGAAVYLAGGDVIEAPGFAVDVIDTVGAGDAFVAGYLSAFLGGLDAPERLRRGNACGAILCMTPGDWESTPTLREVERFFAADGDPVQR